MRLVVPPELFEAARGGQGDGMERLLRTLWPHAYRIARSIVGNDALAEDAAQEACAIMYREISALRSAEAFRVWAYRIVVREALRMAKRHAPERMQPEFPREPDLDTQIDVLSAIGALPAKLRAVIVLTYYAGLSSSEIGAALGMPSATVRFQLVRARKALSTLLELREPVAPNHAEVCHE